MNLDASPTSLQRTLSYLWPVVLGEWNDGPTKLKVELFRNQIMLSTPQAIYSWGVNYRPFQIPFRQLRKELRNINSFLLLGAGLGSAVSLLQEKYRCYPKSVLVDKSELIIELGKQFSLFPKPENATWVCADAIAYLQSTHEKFDLIGVDIFTDMHVEHIFKQEAFYKLIAEHLNPNGMAIFNNIFASSNDHDIVLRRMQLVFNQVQPIEKGINTFTIVRLTK